MTDQLLIRNQVDGILYLTLNNPDRRNSLSSHLLTELNDSNVLRVTGLCGYPPPTEISVR